MLYGALPGTGTGKLSVPHQKPGGPSPSGSCSAAVTAFPVPAVTVAAAVPALVSTSARPAASSSHVRLMMPPADFAEFPLLYPVDRMGRPDKTIGPNGPGACFRAACGPGPVTPACWRQSGQS